MGLGNVILLIVLLGAFGYGAYMFYDAYTNQTSFSQNFVANSPEVLKLPDYSKQFYPNMRFSESRLSYHIEEVCDDSKRKSAREAFALIDLMTIISFHEVNTDGDIEVICSKNAPFTEKKDYFVAGEGGPTKILNASAFYVIKKAQIELFKDETCDKPNVAIHEIFHALGYDHTKNSDSIMYPVTNCKQAIDEELIASINSLYSITSEPDLAISKVDLNKTGRYLNFEVVVNNFGLRDSLNSTLYASSSGEKVGEFTLDEIKAGHAKVFTVTNLKIPGDASEILFEVKSSDGQSEMKLDNNVALLKA